MGGGHWCEGEDAGVWEGATVVRGVKEPWDEGGGCYVGRVMTAMQSRKGTLWRLSDLIEGRHLDPWKRGEDACLSRHGVGGAAAMEWGRGHGYNGREEASYASALEAHATVMQDEERCVIPFILFHFSFGRPGVSCGPFVRRPS